MTTIKERPILFSGPMVRAIIDGRKTMTRRIIKPQPFMVLSRDDWHSRAMSGVDPYGFRPIGSRVLEELILECPHGQPGERLWVRESFDIVDDPAAHDPSDGQKPKTPKGYEYNCQPCVKRGPNGERWVVDYAANENTRIMDKAGDRRWKPSIHMPRWACRITLELTGVRVERLQDISEEDAKSEGVGGMRDMRYATALGNIHSTAHRLNFVDLWDEINGKGAWVANPWVWVESFRRLEALGCAT